MAKDKGAKQRVTGIVRTPDQRLRVFVSSTLKELAPERKAVRRAIESLRLTPVMFESGARPHPADELYRAYLDQSHVFVGIYWQRYGWVAPGADLSGLEDEYQRSEGMPRLLYIKEPSLERDPKLTALIGRLIEENRASFREFSTVEELSDLVENDLAVLLTEAFEASQAVGPESGETLPPTPTNLPQRTASLIGREVEIAKTQELLLQKHTTLTTLTGLGGTGKTSLALEVARGLTSQFPDGVFLVKLESLRDPQLVMPAIAESLGISEPSGGIVVGEAIAESLRSKRTLLVLDNFEQVLDAGPDVARLLDACPNVKVLATSREPLRMRNEHELPLAPLAVPPPSAEADELAESPSVKLFIERARAVRPDFELDNANAASVSEICRRLDGLPLAVELAAARTRSMSPKMLLDRLGPHLELLEGALRDLPQRQQTMQSVMECSYSLLTEAERTLFRRLSVFSGGWTLESAESVTSGGLLRQHDVLRLLSSLVEKSLVVADARCEISRYRFLQTVQQDALRRLAEAGEDDEFWRRHRDHFMSLAEEAARFLKGAEAASWLSRLGLELDNLRAALDSGSADERLRLSAALWRFWLTRGHFAEGRRRCEEAALGADPAVDPKDRGNCLLGAGTLAYRQGDYTGAQRLLEESLTALFLSADRSAAAQALINLGVLACDRSEYAKAKAYHEEGLAIAIEENDASGQAKALNNLGLVCWRMSEYPAAQKAFEDAAVLFEKSGYSSGLMLSYMNIGAILVEQRRYQEGLASHDKCLSLAKEIGDRWGEGVSHINLGNVLWTLKEIEVAEAHFQEALTILRELPNPLGIAHALSGLSMIEFERGDVDLAKTHLRECVELRVEMEDRRGIAEAMECCGVIASASEPCLAAQIWGAAEALREEIGAPVPPNEADWLAGFTEPLRKQLGEARFRSAWDSGRALDADELQALARRSLTS